MVQLALLEFLTDIDGWLWTVRFVIYVQRIMPVVSRLKWTQIDLSRECDHKIRAAQRNQDTSTLQIHRDARVY